MNDSTTNRKRVLLVDDEPLMLMLIHRLLSSEGYAVDTASDGAEALARFEPGKYTLVITDYLMPSMDGLALARAIKTLSPAQPIMMVTGFLDRIKNEGRSCEDIDLVLEKPFRVEQFLEGLTRLVSGQENCPA